MFMIVSFMSGASPIFDPELGFGETPWLNIITFG